MNESRDYLHGTAVGSLAAGLTHLLFYLVVSPQILPWCFAGTIAFGIWRAYSAYRQPKGEES